MLAAIVGATLALWLASCATGQKAAEKDALKRLGTHAIFLPTRIYLGDELDNSMEVCLMTPSRYQAQTQCADLRQVRAFILNLQRTTPQ